MNHSIILKTQARLKISAFLLFGHFVYTMGTAKDEMIKVDHKYTFVSEGHTKFMIQDCHQRQYCIQRNLWYWKWDVIEEWNKVKNGDLLQVRTYGWRIPFLSFFPNIVKIKPVVQEIVVDSFTNQF